MQLLYVTTESTLAAFTPGVRKNVTNKNGKYTKFFLIDLEKVMRRFIQKFDFNGALIECSRA